jgi:hypothetical protein
MLPKIVEPCFAWQLAYGLQGIGPYRGIHQICRGPIGYLFFPVARFFFHLRYHLLQFVGAFFRNLLLTFPWLVLKYPLDPLEKRNLALF